MRHINRSERGHSVVTGSQCGHGVTVWSRGHSVGHGVTGSQCGYGVTVWLRGHSVITGSQCDHGVTV